MLTLSPSSSIYSDAGPYDVWTYLELINYNAEEDLDPPLVYQASIGTDICRYNLIPQLNYSHPTINMYRVTIVDPREDGTESEAYTVDLYNKITDGITWHFPRVGRIIKVDYSYSEDGEIDYSEPQFIVSRITAVENYLVHMDPETNPMYFVWGMILGVVIDGFPSRF